MLRLAASQRFLNLARLREIRVHHNSLGLGSLGCADPQISTLWRGFRNPGFAEDRGRFLAL